MRVIKRGTLAEVEHTCPTCGTTFAYNKCDVTTQYDDWVRTGAESSARWVTETVICPVCYKQIQVKKYKDYF